MEFNRRVSDAPENSALAMRHFSMRQLMSAHGPCVNSLLP
jgi:hypothetical protein